MTTSSPPAIPEAVVEPATSPGGSRVGLALVDFLAVAALSLAGAWIVATLDRFGAVGRSSAALIALPFSLAGPLGVGIERGRTERVGPGLAAFVALGASLGALAGALLLEPFAGAVVLALRAGPALVLGAPLAIGGTRLSRPDEDWRAGARQGPADATPPLALRIAHGRLPLFARVLAAPLAVAALPVGIVLVVLVRCYQITLSRLMPPACRFEPSCSRYGFEALRRFGLARGLALTAYRLGRCQPLCTAGHDPVPEARPRTAPGAAR